MGSALAPEAVQADYRVQEGLADRGSGSRKSSVEIELRKLGLDLKKKKKGEDVQSGAGASCL
jgi:hypothetical protein